MSQNLTTQYILQGFDILRPSRWGRKGWIVGYRNVDGVYITIEDLDPFRVKGPFEPATLRDLEGKDFSGRRVSFRKWASKELAFIKLGVQKT